MPNALERARRRLFTEIDKLPDNDYQARFLKLQELAGQEQAIKRWRGGDIYGDWWVTSEIFRYDFITKYAFAVPNQEALGMLAKMSPILEMGAGSGYWAYLIRRRGQFVVAYDQNPPLKSSYKFTKDWGTVQHGTIETANELQEANNQFTLFLCWPCYNKPFAHDVLKAFTGKTLIYIGEYRGGCTADNDFFDLLDDAWTPRASIQIPQWNGIHDFMTVFERLG